VKDEGERLQLGREKRAPKPGATPSPDYDDDDANWFARFRERRRARRAATKARVAAMSRKRRFARRSMIAGTWLLGLIAALMVSVIVMYYMFTDVRRPDQIPLQQVATIQYADGSTLAKIGTEDRTVIHLEQVPKHVRWAILAAEDRNFYSDRGCPSAAPCGRRCPTSPAATRRADPASPSST